MRPILSLVFLFLFAFPAFAQEGTILAEIAKLRKANVQLAERLDSIEQVQNANNALLTRQKADTANLQDTLDKLTAKLDALAKAQGTTFTAGTADWAGDRKFTATGAPIGPVPSFLVTSGYSSGSGACAGGSCGTGRTGMFGRRR